MICLGCRRIVSYFLVFFFYLIQNMLSTGWGYITSRLIPLRFTTPLTTFFVFLLSLSFNHYFPKTTLQIKQQRTKNQSNKSIWSIKVYPLFLSMYMYLSLLSISHSTITTTTTTTTFNKSSLQLTTSLNVVIFVVVVDTTTFACFKYWPK